MCLISCEESQDLHNELTKYYVLNPVTGGSVPALSVGSSTHRSAVIAGDTIADVNVIAAPACTGTTSSVGSVAVADVQAWFKQADICRER